ncbi:MAG: alpha-keto acid decarboxylase family protein [Candidatus Saganbacteria bacterium]|nr:alpha-keto acid decarboxylase family protein [Candidatus Saganbacteria bacterium]
MKIYEYLIKKIQDTGTRHVFGIQGDYVLNFYEKLCKSPLTVINTCDEQGAGFAADAYARITGFGVVCVTYGVGGLKLANTTAQAFAELSPVLVISGAPGISERKGNPLLHHKVRSFETQINVFREMTSVQAVLDDPKTAASEIDRVINAIHRTKRPGYIELPRDMVQAEINESHNTVEKKELYIDKTETNKALQKVLSMIDKAKNPIIIAGVETHRFGMQDLLLKLIEHSGISFVTGVLSKSVFSENHPQFLGVYAGAMTPDNIREKVEGSDCVIAIGPLITDISTGIFTHNIDHKNAIVLMQDKLFIEGDIYSGIDMRNLIKQMADTIPEKKLPEKEIKRHMLDPFIPEKNKEVTMERFISCLNTFLNDDITIIAEPGDPLFASLDLEVHAKNGFLSCSYYASLGFSVPASVGVELADPNKRPIVLVGDGSFQMTGMEISVAARYGLSPIVIVLNNGGYGTFRPMVDGEFNDILEWRYAEVVKVIGSGKGFKVSNEEELVSALIKAKNNNTAPTIIDVKIGKYDCSKRLRSLTDKLKKSVK